MWVLQVELYGKRVAPKSWTTWFATLLTKELKLQQCIEALWFIKGDHGNLQLEMHMDDGHGCAGRRQYAEESRDELAKHVMLKEFYIHEVGACYQHLKHPIELTEEGLLVGSNPRYIETLLDLLGECGSRVVATPFAEHPLEDKEFETALSAEEMTTFRSGIGLALYIAPDREDIQDAARRLSPKMQQASSPDMVSLVRLARYLAGTRQYRHMISKGGDDSRLFCFADAGFAGDKTTRQSTTCGIFTCVGSCLVSFSRTQKVLSLSSAEAEWYAAVDVACEGLLFMQKVLSFLGVPVALEVHTDSSACIGIAMRSGSGRMRHIETRSLWLQQQVAKRHLQVKKGAGEVNPADIGTKPLAGPRLRSLLLLLQMQGLTVSDLRREVKAISRTAVDPKTVQKILWLCTLFEKVSGTAGHEMELYVGGDVCKALEPKIHEWLSSACFWLALLVLPFLGGWFARSCFGRPPAETPRPTARTSGEATLKRTMMTQSQTTYHLKWQTPRFGVVARGVDGAWPQELYYS